MTSPRDLADRFHERWLRANPFAATMYGIPGYDDLLPDASEEGRQAWRAEAGQFLGEGAAIGRGELTQADAVTLDAAMGAAAQEVAVIDSAAEDHTVTAMHYAGQALAYLTGKLEIERLRDEARRRLGPAFTLPAFHAAVLDHGSLPMPTLARSIEAWLGSQPRLRRPGYGAPGR